MTPDSPRTASGQAWDPARDPRRWGVFGIIAAIYFLVYFHRVSPSVIVPDLVETFRADATALGFMSSMYFYLYAVEQPLVGHLADRFGPRRVVGFWSLGAALGCLLFGLAPTIGWASAGRALIGFGVGGVFIPAMKAFSQWFSQREFATMMGLLLAVGNLGAMAATTPLAWMAQTWGWRASFVAISAITVILALATLLGLRDHPLAAPAASVPPLPTGPVGQSPTGAAVLRVLQSLRFWILFSIFFGVFGAYGALQGLWATPFLMSTLGLDRTAASMLNMILPAGFTLGAPFFGWLADRTPRHNVQLLLAILSVEVLLWIGITVAGNTGGAVLMGVLLAGLGLVTGAMATTFWSLVRGSTPSRVLGLTTGLLNPGPFLGSALLQVSTGAVLDRMGKAADGYSPESFQQAFWACVLAAALPTCLAWMFRSRLEGASPLPLSRTPHSPSSSGR